MKLKQDHLKEALAEHETVLVWIEGFFGEEGCYVRTQSRALWDEIRTRGSLGFRVAYAARIENGDLIMDLSP